MRTAQQIQLPADPFILQRLSREGASLRESLFAYCCARKGLRWAESVQPGSHEGAWPRQLFEHGGDGAARPGGQGRHFTLVTGPEVEERVSERIIARCDVDIFGAESAFTYDPGENEYTGEPVQTVDSDLEALWREQRAGDTAAARDIVIANNDRMEDVEGNPVFCLSAAYMLAYTKMDQDELEASLEWLDVLARRASSLPDADIVKAMLLCNRCWRPTGARWPNRESRLDAAARLALRALERGLPAHRFGLVLLENLFSQLSEPGEVDSANARVLRRAADMVRYACYFSDARLMCTSLVFS